ncbi:cobalamin B12-binding domain-containing protein [Streptomyces sp. NPDC051684]|uniref:cobalamin B12-binding domain-containing protein n=1 Tax=Streptomyces sp. NPDC051684 TaxID=3365670 RepID=UPI003789CA12
MRNPRPHPDPRRPRRAVLSSVSSDSHTWNLVYLQLLLEEAEFEVTNLGACVPPEMLAERALDVRPDLILLSSVNGHGGLQAAAYAQLIKAQPALAGTPLVIGGKLGVAGAADRGLVPELIEAGFDGVFVGDEAVAEFREYLDRVRPHTVVAAA